MKATTKKVSKTAVVTTADENRLVIDSNLIPSLFNRSTPVYSESKKEYTKTAEQKVRGFFSYYREMQKDYVKVVNYLALVRRASETQSAEDIQSRDAALSRFEESTLSLYNLLISGQHKLCPEKISKILTQNGSEILLASADRIDKEQADKRRAAIEKGKAKTQYVSPTLWSASRLLKTLEYYCKK